MTSWKSRFLIAAWLTVPLVLALSGCASGPRRDQASAAPREIREQSASEKSEAAGITPTLDDLRGFLLPARPRAIR